MKDRVRHLLFSLAALATLALAPVAWASPSAVVRDCAEDGSLEGSYSDADKRAALGQIPADLDEYSDCRAVITGALGGAGKVRASASGNGGPGAEAASPVARKAAARRAKRVREARRRQARRAKERELGARSVDPRDGGVFKAANTANGIPLPVTLTLIALALLSLSATLLVLWRRNPDFAAAVRRVIPTRFRQ